MGGYHSLVSDAFVAINTRKVHPVLYPFVLGQTLHAGRISLVFQSIARRSPTPLSWGQYIVGYLMITWGGGLLAHWLLGLPAPMLYSPHMAFNYIFIHLLFTSICKIFPNLLYPPLLDSMLWPLDAILRANGVTSIVDLLSTSKVHLEYRTSALTPLIIGAVVSAGGGVLVGTFSGTTANWTFNTPPFLRAGAGWDGTLDVWGGVLVAFIYSSLTGHSAYSSIMPYIAFAFNVDPSPLSHSAGKVVAATIWGTLFAAKAYKTHWLAQPKVVTTTTDGYSQVSEKSIVDRKELK